MTHTKTTPQEMRLLLTLAVRAKERDDMVVHQRALATYAELRNSGIPAPRDDYDGSSLDITFALMNQRLESPVPFHG